MVKFLNVLAHALIVVWIFELVWFAAADNILRTGIIFVIGLISLGCAICQLEREERRVINRGR